MTFAIPDSLSYHQGLLKVTSPSLSARYQHGYQARLLMSSTSSGASMQAGLSFSSAAIGAINGSGMKRTLPTNEVSPMRLHMHLRKFSCWLFLDLNLCAFWCDEESWHNSTWQGGLPFQCDNEGPPLLAMLKIWFDLMRRAVSSLPHWNLCFEVKGKIGLLSLSRIVGFR